MYPEAEECILQWNARLKLQGKTFAGFAAFKDHLTHSGSLVFGTLEDELAGDDRTKSSKPLLDQKISVRVVATLIAARLEELALGK